MLNAMLIPIIAIYKGVFFNISYLEAQSMGSSTEHVSIDCCFS